MQELYTNRELSWLDFNYRILGEAKDKGNPLFEKIKFLSITASNLDEFCMIRVASLKDMAHVKCEKKDIAGFTPKEQLELISKKMQDFVKEQYNELSKHLMPELKSPAELTK